MLTQSMPSRIKTVVIKLEAEQQNIRHREQSIAHLIVVSWT